MISTTSLVENKKMSNLTWFGVGGCAKYYFQPSSEENLISFLKDNELYLPIYPLGAGSNLIIRDRGFNGIIIHFNKLKEISIDEKGIINSYCGAMDADVARFARNHSRTGLMRLINQRRSLLAYLKKSNKESYEKLIEKLGIRK